MHIWSREEGPHYYPLPPPSPHPVLMQPSAAFLGHKVRFWRVRERKAVTGAGFLYVAVPEVTWEVNSSVSPVLPPPRRWDFLSCSVGVS